MPQDRAQIAPPTSPHSPSRQRRDVHLAEQVAEEGRLGQDLDVQERRARLERNRRELLRRWSWHGEWTSRTGTAKIRRRAKQPSQRVIRRQAPPAVCRRHGRSGRSPRGGARDGPAIHGSTAVVIRTRGCERSSRAARTASFSRAVRPIEDDSPSCDGAPGGLQPGDDGAQQPFGGISRQLGQAG